MSRRSSLGLLDENIEDRRTLPNYTYPIRRLQLRRASRMIAKDSSYVYILFVSKHPFLFGVELMSETQMLLITIWTILAFLIAVFYSE